MAINEVIFPTVPNPVSGDWEKAVNLITKSFQNINDPLQVDGSNIPQGAVFQVGGHVYHADADTAITGTASDYVQLAVSGTTLVPSFVVDLTGVTWNKIYNGYYDASGYLYIFDESKAIANAELTISYISRSNVFVNVFEQKINLSQLVLFPSAGLYNSFASADGVPNGLAYDESTGNLISCDLSANKIYIHSGISSSILSSFATPALAPTAITFDISTGNLISCDANTDTIYIHSGISSSILSSFATPAIDISGLAYDKSTGNLISCDYITNKIYIHSGISSSILSSFTSPETKAGSITYDTVLNNLISSDSDTDRIYIHDGITKIVLDSIDIPNLAVSGLTFVNTVNRLVSCDNGDGNIYVHKSKLYYLEQ